MTRSQQRFRNHTKERGGARTAFTLFEMLVVLAVVSLIAALSWPKLGRYLQENEVRAGAELVRKTVDQCRVKAVDEGVIHQFRYEPYGRRFLIMPYEIAEEATQAPSTTPHTSKKTVVGHVYQVGKTVSFHPPETGLREQIPTERLPEEFLRLLDNGTEYRDVAWSPPFLFYPDGSATDHKFSVEDLTLHSITLSIRSLTGTITASKLEYLSGGSRAR